MLQIMNEYANSGKGPTIHSSGQIEWHNNFVDDKSTQVGGTQPNYHIWWLHPATSIQKRTSIFGILGKPTIDDLVNYSSVHLTSPRCTKPLP